MYAWHREALKGLFGIPDDVTEIPQCGWYKTRLVKGGPYVPARIYIEREIDPETGDLLAPEELKCEVNGRAVDAMDQWPWLVKWPISEQEFEYMTAVALHAGWHATTEPQANPRKPIDWLSVKPPEFK